MIRYFLLIFLFCLGAAPAGAADLMMVRSSDPAPETMATVQRAIKAQGYTISRLQDISESLKKRHYKSDVYYVVFFGKPEEIRRLSAAHPELIPYLPLSLTVFAEDMQTVVVASHPRILAGFFPDPGLRPVFARWERDVRKIMDRVRTAQ